MNTSEHGEIMRRFSFSILLLILFSVTGSAQVSNQSEPLAALALGVSSNSTEPLPETTAARSESGATASSGMDFPNSVTARHLLLTAAQPANERAASAAGLLSFQGEFIKDLVRLTWSVRPDAKALGFAVERRTQTDERWTTVRYLHATPRDNAAGYQYYEHSGVHGVTYYRLRQVEQNGLSTPSPAISVMPQLVPNSFMIWQHRIDAFTHFGTLSFGLGSMMPVTVSIIDAFGRVAVSLMENRALESGHHIIPFATHSLPAGVYTLRMETSNGVQTRRLAIM